MTVLVLFQTFSTTSTNLHAVCEHDTDGHEFGEDPEKLGVGQHAVLQAVIQEAGVVAKHVIDVGRLEKTSGKHRKHKIIFSMKPVSRCSVNSE